MLFFSCKGSHNNESFIPKEYFFPENEIGEGKIFMYVDQLTGDTTYSEYRHQYVGQNRFLIHKAYNSGGTNDSLVYLDRKLIETYSSQAADGSLTKGDILQDTIVSNSKKSRKNILKVRFSLDSTILIINSESEYVKDTTFSWMNKAIPAIVIKTIYEVTVENKLTGEGQAKFNLEFFTYEAKNIGSIRIKILTTADGRIKDIDLKQIRDR
jgi:hypothetical protein